MGRDDAREDDGWRRELRERAKGTIGGGGQINDPMDARGGRTERKRSLGRGQTYRAGEESVFAVAERAYTEVQRGRGLEGEMKREDLGEREVGGKVGGGSVLVVVVSRSSQPGGEPASQSSPVRPSQSINQFAVTSPHPFS
jgi:hypothetical protein